ncbi:MAG: hypothetical protein Q9227_003641 [Pyrenula ochraceoflavens]
MRCSILLLTSLVAGAFASPASNHVRHEKRSHTPDGWVKHRKMVAEEKLPMKIALTQPNLDKAYEYLMEVSHPTSEKFGQHWTAKQVAETFAPSHDTIDAVTVWLVNSGVPAERISQSQSLGWLHFDSTVEEAERLLKTEYHLYRHHTGTPQIACDEYSVPDHIQPHIDFITPTVHFDAKVKSPVEEERKIKRRDDLNFKKRAAAPADVVRRGPSSTAAIGKPVETDTAEHIGLPSSGSLPKSGGRLSKILGELENCNEQIVPDCLRALYKFPPNVAAAPGNSYGIVEYTPQAYLPNDLDLFFANFSPKIVGTRPIFDSIDGGVLQTQNQSFDFNGESDLDLEYAITLVAPQQVTLYQVGDIPQGASFNNFLDAIDGSYCTFEGGDDPTQDGIYPDPLPGGYKGPENCGGFAATKVISTSYGYNEADLTPFYENRQCQEYMKLGLQGVTVLYSSGDYGVAGNGGQCINPVTKKLNNGRSGLFNPSFPSSCPYVTAVGATQIVPNATVTQPEEACETVIYSGGGFSNVFPLPDYQASAVRSWFANHPPPYGADRFNNSQMTKGIPDVAANGANYVIAIDGAFSLVFGTSASSPTFGSIITLINEARIFAGKGSVGFLNPTLYAHPGVLNDITRGNNPGCGTDGFEAVKGWDPVTGLGTPNFPKMLALFLGLP